MKESDQTSPLLVDRFSDPIIVLEGRTITECNRAALGMFGSRVKEEILNRRLSDLSPRKQPDGTLSTQKETDLIADVPKTENLQFEWMFRKSDGEEFPVEVTLGAIHYESRELIGAVLRDLRPYINAHAPLGENGKGYRTTFEKTLGGTIDAGDNGHAAGVNPALSRIPDYDSPEEIMRQTVYLAQQAYVTAERCLEYIKHLESRGRMGNLSREPLRKDGSMGSSHAVRDEAGKLLYAESRFQSTRDRERKPTEGQLALQRDLALELSKATSLDEAVLLTTRVVTQATGCECAGIGIYLINSATGEAELASSSGLPESLLKKAATVIAGSGARFLGPKEKDTPVYFSVHENMNRHYREALIAEGISSITVIPFLQKRGVIVCFNTGPCAIPASSRSTLEFIGMQFGNVMTHVEAEKERRKDLERGKQTDDTCKLNGCRPGETNASLKVLPEGGDRENNALTGKIVASVEQVIQPYVRKLKTSKLDVRQQAWVDIIETNLREITAPFLEKMNGFDFTPKELEVIQLLKEGKSSKEMAMLLHVSPEAVQMYRHRIRKKLGLNKQKTNLQSYLLSLSKGEL